MMTTTTKWMMALTIALLLAITLWGGSILSTALAQQGNGAYVDSQSGAVDNAATYTMPAPIGSQVMGHGGGMMQGHAMGHMQASEHMTATMPYGPGHEDREPGWGMRHWMGAWWSEMSGPGGE